MTEKKTAIPRLKKKYRESIIPEMKKVFGFTNDMEVPRLDKIVINIGVSEAKDNIKALDTATAELTAITGQKPKVTRAKQSISNFKLRKGMPIGLMVTVRGDRMYEFLDRFISCAAPRIRDFKGFDRGAFDGQGNYNLGMKEQYIFPEVNVEKSDHARGMNITFAVRGMGRERVTDQAQALLELFGFPFRRK